MDSYPQYPIVKLEEFPPVLGVLDSYLDRNTALYVGQVLKRALD